MSKRSIFLILLLILFAVLVFVFKFTSIPIVSDLSQQFFGLPKSILYELRIGFLGSDSDKAKKLSEENEKIRKMLVDYERLKKDNDALHDQFELQTTNSFKLLPAKVLGAQGRFSSPTALIIDQGEKAGVKKDMAVIVGNNLIGKIDIVSDVYAKIILVQNDNFATIAKSVETGALGVIKGHGDFILFDQVGINDKVSNGQLIVTKGEVNDRGFGIPPDLVIGKIGAVNRSESLPYQSAKVENASQIFRIDTVFIVISL